jgi:stage II sporulation protein R
MKMEIKMKRLRAALSIVTLILVLTVLPIRGEEAIYSSVIRLHIIANSNTDTDQQMKLYVRDRILELCGEELVSENKNARDAMKRMSEDGGLDGVLNVAKRAVSEFCTEREIPVPDVRITLGDEKYPRRYYEGLAFPSGTYHSLRVIIGEGEGENWWCVLFPPLCFSAASEPNDSDFISVGLTPDQYNVISGEEKPKYRVRFRIIEWIEELFDKD